MRFQPISPIGNGQTVAFTTSTQSAALGTGCRYVQVCASAACWLAIGANPAAVKAAAGTIYLPANVPMILGAVAGQKIAAIQDGAGGNLNILEGDAL